MFDSTKISRQNSDQSNFDPKRLSPRGYSIHMCVASNDQKNKNTTIGKKNKKKFALSLAFFICFFFFFFFYFSLFCLFCFFFLPDAAELSFFFFLYFFLLRDPKKKEKLSRTEPHDDSSIYKPISPEGDLNSIHCGPAGLTRHQHGVAWWV